MRQELTKSLKTFYGISDFGFVLMTSVEGFYFLIFLTNVAKFSLPMVALISTVTSVVDAILSPFYGVIISGTKPLKWGRNRSWLLIAPPLVVLFFMLQFSKIGPEPVAAFIVCAGFILSHIIWNIQWVANVSLISVLGKTPEDRGLLASRRAVWTGLGGVAFSYIGLPIIGFFANATGSELYGYSILAGIMALSMLLGSYFLFMLTNGYEEMKKGANDAPKEAVERIKFSDMFKSAIKNPPLLVLLLADFFKFMPLFIVQAGGAYYFMYVMKDMNYLPLYILITALGGVVGSFLAGFLVKKFTLRQITIYGMFLSALGFIVGKFVAFNPLLFFIALGFGGIFMGVINATVVGLYSDVCVYDEWKTGRNATPFVMGLQNLSLKVAIVSRGIVIPVVLGAAGFVEGMDPANATLEIQNAVNTALLLIPGIFLVIAGVILSVGYKLTREQIVEYEADIAKRA